MCQGEIKGVYTRKVCFGTYNKDSSWYHAESQLPKTLSFHLYRVSVTLVIFKCFFNYGKSHTT